MQDISVISLWMVLVANKEINRDCIELCVVYCITGFIERFKVWL